MVTGPHITWNEGDETSPIRSTLILDENSSSES